MNMQDGELFYRFNRILNNMLVTKIFIGADVWTEFENIYQLFIQRFSGSFPSECRIINTYAVKMLSHKKCSWDEVDFVRYMVNIVSEEYEEKEERMQIKKTNKVFISHSQKDIKIVEKFVDLLNRIGLDRNTLFCSSVPGYNIKQGSGDIFDYLRSEFDNNNLFVVFMLSKNYYESAACLNEMGATWILQNQYQTILLPGFEFEDIKGAINPRDISFKLDDKFNRISAMGEFKDNIIDFLQLNSVDSSVWDYSRERFFNEIDNIL